MMERKAKQRQRETVIGNSINSKCRRRYCNGLTWVCSHLVLILKIVFKIINPFMLCSYFSNLYINWMLL